MASVADTSARIEAQERFERALIPQLLNMLGGKVTFSHRDLVRWTAPGRRFEVIRTDTQHAIELELRDLTDVELTVDTHRGRLELTRADLDLLHELKAGRAVVTPK